MYRVVHIPEDEAVLLNSREKAPYLICLEVLRSETVRYYANCIKLPKLKTQVLYYIRQGLFF